MEIEGAFALVRAHLARDPKGLEAQMARGLGRGLSTGR